MSDKEKTLYQDYFSAKTQKTLQKVYDHIRNKSMLWSYYLRMKPVESGLFIDYTSFQPGKLEVRREHFLEASKTAKIFLDNLAFADTLGRVDGIPAMRF